MARRGTAASIDLGELEKLAALQCTNEEIAFWFGVTTRTVERRRQQRPFREAIERGRAKGRISMRRAQPWNCSAIMRTWGSWSITSPSQPSGPQYSSTSPATSRQRSIALPGRSHALFGKNRATRPAKW